ncbi:MAG TPA: hypothetical protein DCZ03_13125 [Gammaproteobacteria bacterium]|nr:hypothetical protein [Gammaproteobacteria bacterium]
MSDTLIQYDFRLSEELFEYQVRLDPNSLAITEENETYPDWVLLQFHQCPHCPLKPEETQYCPLAKHISHAVDFFAEMPSFEQLQVAVSTKDRKFLMQTDAQDGMRSLLGLIMATAGCPHMNWFKPMARFHLPKANLAETIYRVTSMYLLAQHFVAKNGGEPDWELQKLPELYGNVDLVNTYILKRLRSFISKDCSLNALVILTVFSTQLNESVTEPLAELEYLFSDFLPSPHT